MYKIGIWSSLSFWLMVNFAIYAMLTVAFVYRIADLATHDAHRSYQLRLVSFREFIFLRRRARADFPPHRMALFGGASALDEALDHL